MTIGRDDNPGCDAIQRVNDETSAVLVQSWGQWPASTFTEATTEATRRRLPNRRPHWLYDFEHNGRRYTGGVGRFDNGDLAETFLNSSKTGADVEVNSKDAAIVASIALQHRTPVETIRHALTRDGRGRASGALGAFLDLLAAEKDAAP